MGTRRLSTLVGLVVALTSLPFAALPVAADTTAQTLPFTQDWTNIGLITANDNWSGVPGIEGYFIRNDASSTTAVDPQTILGDTFAGAGAPELDVNANQTNPNTFSTGGATEFHVTDPVVALAGSGTADAPYLLLHLNTTGQSSINVAYNARDIDASTDNAVQQLNLQYRVGSSGAYTNVTTGTNCYIADATTGPSLATLVTPVSCALPPAADNQSLVQLRIMTTNAVGNDEWVGIDDISITVGAGTPTLSIDDVTLDEGNVGSTTFTFTVSLSANAGVGGVTFDIATADDTAQDDNPATEDNDYVGQSLTSQTIPEGSDSYTFNVTVNGDTAPESDETFFVNVTNVTGATVGDGQGVGTINDDDTVVCGTSYTPIHDIQGNGASTPIPGTVTTEGIVTGDFEGTTSVGLQGFWIQEADAAVDADPQTSEGIFVFTGDNASVVSVGDRVRVEGYARETFSQTSIHGSDSNTAATTEIDICSTGNSLPVATTLTLPFASATAPEPYEGMRVVFTQALVISEYFEFARFGEILLAEPLNSEPRPFTGTALDEPGAAANARTAANALSRIRLDDGLGVQNPETLRHPNGAAFSLANRFRGGDTVQDAIGVLAFAFGSYRIEPTGPATYTSVNPRPAAPDPGGLLQVGAMNTLNFFITGDYPTGNPLDNDCGPANNVECRGHDADQTGPPLSEFERQRQKLVAAISGLNAEVLGLNELENTTGVDPLGDPEGLVPALNALLGPGTYDHIDTGVIGGDAIRVGMIYQPAAVTPVGDFEILDSSDDPNFIDTLNRPVLAQTFMHNASGGVFTVAVVHLKSKGSACGGDPDIGDGQGNCNGTRTAAAEALVDWLATDPTGSGDPDFLIVGDMNAYAMEDPIDAVKLGADDTPNTEDDYVDLHDLDDDVYEYSYLFDAQFGYLDHALAIKSLAVQATGEGTWHINADEPNVFDYDMSFKGPNQEALYEPNAFRASDHDPIIVGLDLIGCADAPFTDVPVEHPFCPEIDWAERNDIANGYDDGTYGPELSVTRQAMAAFLARLSGETLEPCTVAPFTDVQIDHPFCAEIKWMADNGISTGYNDDTYRPTVIVTRQAMAAFLARMVGDTLDPCPPGPPYSDVPDGHAFCAEIKWLHNSGITNGFEDGTYRPVDPVTRQAMAAFLYRTAPLLPQEA